MAKMKKDQKILQVMKELLGKNGATTTLEVKDECRKRWPKKSWFQGTVSQVMAQSGYHFLDNGIHRTYLNTQSPGPATVVVSSQSPIGAITNIPPVVVTTTAATAPVTAVSRTELVKRMKNSKGKFYTITFTKNNGDQRVLNCKSSKKDFMDDLGYIKTKDCKNRYKLVNPRTITELRIGGEIFVVK